MAKIKKFYTRSELGMRRPRSVSYNITPNRGGAAVHYGGAAQRISTEAQARGRWLAWQNYHMDHHKWADIGYTAGYDNWGNVYAGRGFGVRTAGQGTNYGNQNYHAFVWIGGGTERPSAEAEEALNWLILEARKGGAGLRVRPHNAFRGTACPGTLLVRRAALLDNKRTLPGPTAPEQSRDYITVGDKGAAVKEWQQLLIKWNDNALPRFGADGDFGSETAEWTVKFYKSVGLTASDPSAPRVGPTSLEAIRKAIGLAFGDDNLDDLKADAEQADALVAAAEKALGDSRKELEQLKQTVASLKQQLAAAESKASAAATKVKSAESTVATRKSAAAAAWAAYESAKSKPQPEPQPKPQPPPPPPPEPDRNYVTVGDKGPAVKSWQESLIKWNRNALPRFGADGDFGNETLEWSLRFYDAIGMSVSDRSRPRVGPATRDAMAKALRAPKFTFSHSVLVRRGDKGPAVTEWQRALRTWRSDALPRFGADGDFGAETDDWTRRFQRAAKITVDGIVGPQTRSALIAAL